MSKKTLAEAFARLKEIKEQFPELTFDNDGYEYLSKEVQQKHKKQIDEISAIIKEQAPRFVRFDNFKPRKDGTFSIRCQTHWDERFVGVEYLSEVDFDELIQNEPKIPPPPNE